jgi:hypothetical protein
MDYQGGAAFLVHMGSLYSIPICVALCIGGSMSLAFLGGACGIVVAKLVYRVRQCGLQSHAQNG